MDILKNTESKRENVYKWIFTCLTSSHLNIARPYGSHGVWSDAAYNRAVDILGVRRKKAQHKKVIAYFNAKFFLIKMTWVDVGG